MTRKDLLLDFTSLLDVTLIVIFFFVLFSHLDSEQMREETDRKLREYDTAIAAAQDSRQTADTLAQELADELSRIREAEGRQGENLEEMRDFDRSLNLKVFLDMKEGGWVLRIVRDQELKAVLTGHDDMAEDLLDAFEAAGYDREQTVFCDFVYDGSAGGTRAAYRAVKNGFREVISSYRFLYISETNLSVGSDQSYKEE